MGAAATAGRGATMEEQCSNREYFSCALLFKCMLFLYGYFVVVAAVVSRVYLLVLE